MSLQADYIKQRFYLHNKHMSRIGNIQNKNHGRNNPKLPSLIILCCLFFVCCNSLDDINNRLDKLETKITDLQSATDALQKAYADGKVIKSVSLVTAAGEEADGWHIAARAIGIFPELH